MGKINVILIALFVFGCSPKPNKIGKRVSMVSERRPVTDTPIFKYQNFGKRRTLVLYDDFVKVASLEFGDTARWNIIHPERALNSLMKIILEKDRQIDSLKAMLPNKGVTW
jgi:hypothetical protein